MDEQQEAPPAAASDDLATTLASLTAERDEARTALAASRESYAGAMNQLLAARSISCVRRARFTGPRTRYSAKAGRSN